MKAEIIYYEIDTSKREHALKDKKMYKGDIVKIEGNEWRVQA